MCSHDSIMWQIKDNSVIDRMIGNSLVHRFTSSRKVQRRTKALNAAIKQCGVKDYKHYVKLKTSIIRNLENETDTGDSSSLTDVDYDIIYNSPVKRADYMAKSFRYSFINEDYQGCKTSTLPLQFSSDDDTISSRIKSKTEYMKQNRRDSNATDKLLNSKSNTISNKTKSVSKRKVQNQKHQNDTTNESNAKFNSHYQSSLAQISARNNDSDSELNSLIKSKDDSTSKSTTVIKDSAVNAKNCDSTRVSRKPELLKNVKRNLISALEKTNSMNGKDIGTNESMLDELNYDHLLSDIVNLNQHSTPLTKTRNNTAKMNLPSDASSQDQKDSGIDEDSEDKLVKIKRANKIPMSQDMEENTKEISISSPRLKKIVEDCEEGVKDEELKSNDILEKQIITEHEEPSEGEEIKNSQLNQIDINLETNQGDEHYIEIEDSSDIQKQQLLSPKENSMKKVHWEPCLLVQEDGKTVKKLIEKEEISIQLNKEDNTDSNAEVSSIIREGKQDCNEEKKSSEEEINQFLQLSQIDNVTEINSTSREDQTHSAKSENRCDVQKQLLSPKSYNEILDENNRRANEEKEGNNCLQLNEIDKDIKVYLKNEEDKTCVKLKDTHDLQKQQTSLPKIMCTEILDKKYKIIDKKDDEDIKNNIEKIDVINNTDIANAYTPTKKNTLIHCQNIIDHNTDNWQEATVNEKEIDRSIVLESDDEEDNINCMSPQTKKRLQQQARLNLVVNSNSSDSEDEYVITKPSQNPIDSLNTNHCCEDDRLKDGETNCASKQTEMDISCSEDIYTRKETISTPIKKINLDSSNTKEDIKKKEPLTRCTYENNDSLQSVTNKNLLQEMQNCENVHNNDGQSQKSLTKNFQLTVSESNISCNNKESINQFQRHKQPLLDKENMYIKNNQNKETISSELETRHESEHEQSVQASTKWSDTHLKNISCQYRPRNLQELVEDQELHVETIPASFTLADLSEDEETFILNVPSKVVQSNLQDQLLTIKNKYIKFNKSKYRIICKEVGTTSCLFATGKKQKAYKIINIKNICTITVQEKLPRDSSAVLNSSSSTVSSVPKPKKNQQTDSERDSKMMEVSNKKRKRKQSSESETRHLRKRKK